MEETEQGPSNRPPGSPSKGPSGHRASRSVFAHEKGHLVHLGPISFRGQEQSSSNWGVVIDFLHFCYILQRKTPRPFHPDPVARNRLPPHPSPHEGHRGFSVYRSCAVQISIETPTSRKRAGGKWQQRVLMSAYYSSLLYSFFYRNILWQFFLS